MMLNKFTRIILTILCIVFLSLTPVWAQELNSSGISIVNVVSSSDTSPVQPAGYLVDGREETYWGLNSGANQSWVELTLEDQSLIYGIKLSGSLALDTKLFIEYQRNGHWISFTAASIEELHSAQQLIDLSFDRIVTDVLRLRLVGSGTALSRLAELQVLGESSDKIYYQIYPTSVQASDQTSANYPEKFLIDDNTHTMWMVDNFSGKNRKKDLASDLGEVFFSFADQYQFQNINIYFTEEVQGDLRVEVKEGSTWREVEHVYQDSHQGWYRIDFLEPVSTDHVRVTMRGSMRRLGGISEVQFWGYGSYLGKVEKLIGLQRPIPMNKVMNRNFTLRPDEIQDYYLELVLEEETEETIQIELNGQELVMQPTFILRGHTVYRQLIPDTYFWEEVNFLAIHPLETNGTLMTAKLTVPHKMGRVGHSLPGLDDRLLLISNQFIEQEIQLEELTLVEKVQIFTEANNTYFYLYAWVDERWVEISQDGFRAQGVGFVGPFETDRLRIKNVSGFDVGEIQILGSQITDQAPMVEILSPQMGEVLEHRKLGQMELVGFVDNPEAQIMVNGRTVFPEGHYFTTKLVKTGVEPWEVTTITATARDEKNRVSEDQVEVYCGERPLFTVDQPDELVYTDLDQFKVSGLVQHPGGQVTVNGEPVVHKQPKGGFSTNVSLVEGLNLIKIEYAFEGSEQDKIFKSTAYRKVVRYSGEPELTIDTPVSNFYTNQSSIIVTGVVSGMGDLTVKVNGYEATLDGMFYTSPPIPLIEGNNLIEVEAIDSKQSVIKKVEVIRDSIAPSLKEILPEEEYLSSEATINVSGNVIDQSTSWVYVNGNALLVDGQSFTEPVTYPDGNWTISIKAVDLAGNRSEHEIHVMVDTTPPEVFEAIADPDVWTSNNQPSISFETTDATSGVDHYEISIDGGEFVPVTSPYQLPVHVDGEHEVQIKAIDLAGWETLAETKVYIDTTPPKQPEAFRVVPGNAQMILKWVAPDPDVIEYRIIRIPEWSEELYKTVIDTEFTDLGLQNGETYIYQVWAVDRAYNEGVLTEPDQAKVGLVTVEYEPEVGSVVEYEDVTLFVQPESLSEMVESIEITEIESEELEEQAIFPIISPIYHMSVTMKDGQSSREVEHVTFEEDYVGQLQYDESLIPEGFPEQNLGVYYYDSMWGRWFKVEKSGVDEENNTIYFATNHFTPVSIQPTMIEDLSPQELSDVGYSPFATKISHNGVTVSPQGGSAMTEVTELVLPGKNGFDFVLKRTYDSATARGDGSGLSINAQLGISLGKGLGSMDEVVQQLLKSSQISLGAELERMIKDYFQNNGDYAYSMGLGWRLNLPYIRGSNSTVLVRDPNGSFHSMNQMKIVENKNTVGVYRELHLENHNGSDFTLYLTQKRIDIDFTRSISTDKMYIPGWQLCNAKLVMKDGTIYEMDGLGRTTKIIDPMGFNTIELHYGGPTIYWYSDEYNLHLDYIKDSMGREVHFEYDESIIIPKIKRIWVENDPIYQREINYIQDSGGNATSLIPLLTKAIDVGGREWNYEYGVNYLFSGGVGLKVNMVVLLGDLIAGYFGFPGAVSSFTGIDDFTIKGHIQNELVFPLKSTEGPGIGYTKISYDQKPLVYNETEATDYLFGFIPTGVEFSFELLQRLLVEKVELYKTKEDSPIRTTNYTYDLHYYDHDQFHNRKTVINDGRAETHYYFGATVKRQWRWMDISDYGAELINNLIQAGGKIKGFIMEAPSNYRVVPYNTTIEKYDAVTMELLEKQTFNYDLEAMRPTRNTVTRGDDYIRVDYVYDDWGNVTYSRNYSQAHGHTNEVRTWTHYLNTNSTKQSGVSWKESPFSQGTVDGKRRNLVAGIVIANYIPQVSDESKVQYLHTYNRYNKQGQLTGMAQWNDKKWAITELEYDSAGYLKRKVNPEGHTTAYGYDQHGFLTTITEKDVKNAQDEVHDIVIQKGYEYYSGWVKWEKNPRGFVTEYEYDALGRITKIISPSDDDADHLDWVPNGATPEFRLNNPSSSVEYDDANLTSVVTDARNNQTKYEFDSLGRMSKLTKQKRENESYVPAAVTTLGYDQWGNITSITEPNGHATGYLWKYTTHYEYDAMGRNTTIIYPDDTEILDDNPRKVLDFDYSTNILEVWNEREIKTTQYLDMQNRVVRQTVRDDNYELIENKTYFDGLGNQVITIDPNGSKTIQEYNALNLLEKINLPTETFLENDQPVTVSPYQRFEYNKVGQKIKDITSLLGDKEHETTYEPDGLGRVIRTSTTFTENGQINSVVTESYYDDNGNLVRMVDANNTPLTFTEQKGFEYTYSAQDLVLTETDPAGNVTSYTYDAVGNRHTMTDPRGNSDKYDGYFTIVYHYDDLNRLVRAELPISSEDAEESVETEKSEVLLQYDARGNLIERIEPDGGKTSYTYYPRNWVHTETVEGDSKSYLTEFFYDTAGNQTIVRDPLGEEIVQTYDPLNRLKKITYLEENEEIFEYDKVGNRTAYIDGRKNRTEYSYNDYGKLEQVKDAKIQSTYYKYDRWGNMTRKANALGHVTKYKYDDLNRLIEEIDSQGHVTQYGYDLVGNRDYSLDPNGTVGDYDYYPNNLLQKMTLTNGEEVQAAEYFYDEAGYVMETNNGEVVTQYNTYADGYQPDPFGRIRKMDKVIDGQTFTVEYSYDVMGRVTGVKSPTGNWVNYNYNNLGQLISVPGYINQAPVYDERGILESLIAANGITTSWEYDNNGRLTGLDYHHQSALVKGYDLGYDNTNNIVTKNDDTFNYDKLNQLVFANLKGKFENNPDEEEQLVGRTLSDYSGQNNLEVVAEQSKIIELDYAGGSIGVDLQGTVSVSRVELTPDSPVHRVNENSLEIYYSLDNYHYTKVEDWELVTKKHGKLMLVLDTPVSARYIKVKSYADERDNSFRPINTAQFFNTAEDIIQVYYYVTSRTESYSYDAAGNRLSETITQRNSVSRGYSYYSNSNLLKSNGKYGYVYDANGNLTKKGENYSIAGDSVAIDKGDGEYLEYEYDLFNRLRRVIKPIENGTEVTEYTYDESGLRLKKESTSYEADEDLTTEKAPDQVVYYIFGQNGEVLYEQEDREYMEYIYVLGGHFARVDGNLDNAEVTRYFYHTDHLGSAVLVTDESGETVWSSEYTPFGKIAMEEGILAKAAKFTGKDLDEDTGLYYYNARWYDQEIGRFISSDPLRYGLNWYVYSSNNPIRFIDPSGLFDYDFSGEPDEYEKLYEQYKPDPLGALGKPINKALDFVMGPIRKLEIDYDYYSIDPFYYRSLALGYIENKKSGSELSIYEYGMNNGYIDHKYGAIDIYDIELGVDLCLAHLGLDNFKDGFESTILQRTMISGSEVTPIQAKLATFAPFLSLSMLRKGDEFVDIAKDYAKKVSSRTSVVGDYASSISASNILRQELYLAGVKSPPYPNAAHHIVPWDDFRALEARKLLESFGIQANSATNGVFLPYKINKYVGNETLHIGRHSREYIDYITDSLNDVYEVGGSTSDVVDVLNQIRMELLDGTLKLNQK